MPNVDAVVVDASVAVKWRLTDEQYSTQALALLARFRSGEIDLAAPTFIRLEVASALLAAALRREPRLRLDEAREAVERFFAVELNLVPDDDLILPAFSLVLQFGCSIYDALYLALAQQLSLPLLTADHRFYRLVQHLPEVVWLGSYAPAS